MLDNIISPSCLSLESIDMHSAGLGKKYSDNPMVNFTIGNFSYFNQIVAYQMNGYNGDYGYGEYPFGQQIWVGDSRTTNVSVLHDKETTLKYEQVGTEITKCNGCQIEANQGADGGDLIYCPGHETPVFDWVPHPADPYTKMEDVTVKVLSNSAPIDWKTWIPNGKLNTLILYGNGIMFWHANSASSGSFEAMYIPDTNGNLQFDVYGNCTNSAVNHAYPEIRFGTLPAEMWNNGDPVMYAHKKYKGHAPKVAWVDVCKPSRGYLSFIGDTSFVLSSYHPPYSEGDKKKNDKHDGTLITMQMHAHSAETYSVTLNRQFQTYSSGRGDWVQFRSNPSGLMPKYYCFDQDTDSSGHNCVFAFYPFGR